VLKKRQHRVVNDSLRRWGVRELSFAETSRYFDIYRWEKVARGYDIIQPYGVYDVWNCLIGYPDKPYVACDYGSPLRVTAASDSVEGMLTRAGYRGAEAVVLTNPDVRPVMDELGIADYCFIPHPVDETKYCPGPSAVRDELEARYGSDLTLVFCPARHDWAVKGNEKLLKAFARVARELSRPLLLILNDWGQDVRKSRRLISREEIEARVLWLPMLPKSWMLEYYRAADIVADQFNIGTFGLSTPEAMACGKPVILHWDSAIHDWCYQDEPPLARAQEEEEIYCWLRELVQDPALRTRLGEQSRDWVEREHGWERVTTLHRHLYDKVAARQRAFHVAFIPRPGN